MRRGSGRQGGPPVEPRAPCPRTRAVSPTLGRGAQGGERRRGRGGPPGGSGRSQALQLLRTGLGLGSGVTCLELGTPSCEVLSSQVQVPLAGYFIIL